MGEHGHREGDLVELRADGALQAPAQAVGQADDESPGTARQSGRRASHGPGGPGEEGVLDDEQGQAGWEHAVDGAQQDQDRVEVVAEQVEAGPFDGDDGPVPLGVGFGGLREDGQVPAGGGHHPPLPDGVEAVHAQSERADHYGDGQFARAAADRSHCASYESVVPASPSPPRSRAGRG